jgi:hypothetical protein
METINALPNLWLIGFFNAPLYTVLGTCAVVYTLCVIVNTFNVTCKTWGG